jgi:hypothetical protein
MQPQLPPEPNPRRRRRRRRNQDPWYATRRAKIAIGFGAAAVAGGIVWIVFDLIRNRGRKPKITDATVIDENGNVIVEPSNTNQAKSVAPAKLPDEILAGGVPIEDPWHTVGWYTYPEGQRWIRVDQYGDVLFQEGPTTITEHTATINGRWRWIVIAGNATWLATGEVPQQTYKVSKSVLRLRYDQEDATNQMIDAAAKQAATWIDNAYSLQGAPS